MKNPIKLSLFTLILAFSFLISSCSHHQGPGERSVASTNCLETVKGEYQTYFDSVEKCIEKQSDK